MAIVTFSLPQLGHVMNIILSFCKIQQFYHQSFTASRSKLYKKKR
nr:MAG TPA: hypothetical protein [Caudoviricetes sp.]